MTPKVEERIAKKALIKWLTQDLDPADPESERHLKELEEIIEDSIAEGKFEISGEVDVLDLVYITIDLCREYFENEYLPYLAER